MPNYEKLSVEELDKKFLEARKDKVEAKAEMTKINAVRMKKVDEVKALAKFDAMSDHEKQVIAQSIGGAGGIPSEEKVGEPGTG